MRQERNLLSDPWTDPGRRRNQEESDHEGNQLPDARWNYTWDAENRLLKMESLASAPAGSKRRLEFANDFHGRRIWRTIINMDTSSVLSETSYLYDGWNLVARLTSANALIRTDLLYCGVVSLSATAAVTGAFVAGQAASLARGKPWGIVTCMLATRVAFADALKSIRDKDAACKAGCKD